MIQSPKVFGQILLEAPALLTRSEYAFPLYELLADHVSREEGVLQISLADLKRYLGLKGRYPVFQMFKVRVLAPSLESINTNTDLHVSYESHKCGQAISGLAFQIQRKPRPMASQMVPLKTLVEIVSPVLPPIAAPTQSPEEQAFLDRLVQHQISEADAAQALQKHGLDGAREIFGHVRQEVMRRKGTAEEIRNVPAYLARCLREGFGRKSAVSEVDCVVEQTVATQSAAHHARAEANAALLTQTAEVMARFTALPVAEQIALERAFLEAEPIWAMRPVTSISRIKALERWLASYLINSSI